MTQPSARPRLVLPCLLACAVAGTAACGPRVAPPAAGTAGPGSAATSSAAPETTVDTVTVVSKMLETTARLPGELQPYESVAIYAKVSGFVEWIGVDRGSRVKEGELIARLSAPEVLSQRAEAESRLQGAQAQKIEAESRLASNEGTLEKLTIAAATPGVISGNELEVARKNVEADRARAEALRRSEDAARSALASFQEVEGYLRIRAPFAGIVTERNVHPGALVGPAGGAGVAAPLLRIETTGRLRLVVPVPEADASAMSEGAEVLFTVPAFPGETFSGTVARSAHAVEVRTRTMPVEVDVNNASGRLASGMFPEVRWPVRRDRSTLFVPTSSVTRTTERLFIVRIDDGQVDQVNVTLGATSGGLVEIFGDLHEGDQVALHGTDELRNGTRVTPRPAPSPSVAHP
jgi:RND family efflux transporter MFP subunit